MKSLLILLFLIHLVTSRHVWCEESPTMEPVITASVALIERGSYADAERSLRNALSAPGFDEDGLYAARIYRELGEVLDKQGKSKEACAFFKRMMEIRVRLIPADSPTLAEVRIGLIGYAHALIGISQYVEALTLIQEAYHSYHSIKEGEKTEAEARSIVRLFVMRAEILIELAKYGKAEMNFKELLDSLSKKRDPKDESVILISGKFANFYNRVGKYSEALEYSSKATFGYAAKFGEEHPELIGFMTSQATALHKLGRLEEAETVFLKAQKIAEAKLISGHPATATIWSGLAMVYLDQGRFPESDKLLRKSLAAMLNVYGKEHFTVLVACSRIGDWNRAQNLHADAAAYYQRAFELTKINYPDFSPERESLFTNYALSLRALNRNDDALVAEEEARQVKQSRSTAMKINPQEVKPIFIP